MKSYQNYTYDVPYVVNAFSEFHHILLGMVSGILGRVSDFWESSFQFSTFKLMADDKYKDLVHQFSHLSI